MHHDSLRDQFLIDPEVAFLNHGSFGATPRPVFERYQEWQRELERQPVEFLGRRFNALMADARAALGAYLNTPADSLVFVPNATMGMNIVARSIALEPGDEVVSTDHEYGAIDRMWRVVCGDARAIYKPVSVPLPVTTHADVVERIWSAVTPRTRVLSVSHITSRTALRLPVEELCRRAREAGIVSVVDGAHAPGQIPVDLEAVGADFYTANAHKWMCAPKGSAFLQARPGMDDRLKPLVVGWDMSDMNPTGSCFLDVQQWTGTRDIAAFLSVPAAIAFQREKNWPAVRERCRELLAGAREAVARVTCMPQICPDSPDWFTQMAVLELPPGTDGAKLQHELYDRFKVELPIGEWNDRVLMRVAVQGYNTQSDLDRLVIGLKELLV
ncbi:MAG TPA: aminotransferase class V-fold PLP-dependent enzyme [Opitutaceae bacterium]|nr:aminotransferase class V-fold PLP-dependent enzyme [Opitutaceae bacterium]